MKNKFFTRRFVSARCLTQSLLCTESSAEMGIKMELIKGANIANEITQQIQKNLQRDGNAIPHLAIIRVGENPQDLSYEKNALKRMDKANLLCTVYSYPETISPDAFQQEFLAINNNPSIHGILLLRPLPNSLKDIKTELLIHPDKDVDGISPLNLAKVFSGDSSGFAPCTAEAVIQILHYQNISLAGKHVAIIGRSLVVGKPLAMLCLQKDATVTVCHSKTPNLLEICQSADILITCIGKARAITSEYIPNHCVVIDVGINADSNGTLCGDVDFGHITNADYITPVPGGVGAVTTAVLARHVADAFQRLSKSETESF